MCGCLLCAPYWGPGPQPRQVPWLGIELATLSFTGWCSTISPFFGRGEPPTTLLVERGWGLQLSTATRQPPKGFYLMISENDPLWKPNIVLWKINCFQWQMFFTRCKCKRISSPTNYSQSLMWQYEAAPSKRGRAGHTAPKSAPEAARKWVWAQLIHVCPRPLGRSCSLSWLLFFICFLALLHPYSPGFTSYLTVDGW